ncbi:MAG: 50S ribosomal protein L9 [Deltaproteobacteria bacterium]|nr:50S ribosomal protein L9 [Deltaproteobacteria bacterium]
MEVILKEDIPNLGKAGDVIKVREGFGRNYLLPQKKAFIADKANQQLWDQQKKKVEAKRAKEKEEAGRLAEKLATLICTITKQAGEEDKLFGSVTTMDIAQALAKEGLAVDKKLIHLDEPIKQVGSYVVQVKLHTEVVAKVTVKVVKK